MKTKWLNARRQAWLCDHPSRTEFDYDYAGSYGDTPEGQKSFAEWHIDWMAREGRALRRTALAV
jgi:hypothetical protein